MKKVLSGVAGISLCLLLSACGSGSSTNSVTMENPAKPDPVAVDVASQVDLALTTSEANSETAEPQAIEAVTVPANEDGEPKSL